MSDLEERANSEDLDTRAIASLQRSIIFFGPEGERWLPGGNSRDGKGRCCIISSLHQSVPGDLTHSHYDATTRARAALRKACLEQGHDNVVRFNIAATEFSQVKALFDAAIELLEWGFTE